MFPLVWFFLAIQLVWAYVTSRIYIMCVPKGLCRDRDSSPYSMISGSCSLTLLARRSTAIPRNCSRAASRSSTISCVRTSGSGRLSDSSRLSSLSQKMPRLALSRLMRAWLGLTTPGGDVCEWFLFLNWTNLRSFQCCYSYRLSVKRAAYYVMWRVKHKCGYRDWKTRGGRVFCDCSHRVNS